MRNCGKSPTSRSPSMTAIARGRAPWSTSSTVLLWPFTTTSAPSAAPASSETSTAAPSMRKKSVHGMSDSWNATVALIPLLRKAASLQYLPASRSSARQALSRSSSSAPSSPSSLASLLGAASSLPSAASSSLCSRNSIHCSRSAFSLAARRSRSRSFEASTRSSAVAGDLARSPRTIRRRPSTEQVTTQSAVSASSFHARSTVNAPAEEERMKKQPSTTKP
mmetsp:Transcript_15107/g.59143  ORF Transcript_15107/g.59143 Transcript_15107/m.59143 type:complete len:222 (+) Transcript_15107:2126-2791(+)